MVKLGHVAIDGTKIKANASKHKAMSHDRMNETEQRLRQEVEELLRRAVETDEAEAALEQEAKEQAERQRAEAEAKIAQRREREARTGKPVGGYDPKVPDPEQAKPGAEVQRNFTDPDSRIMVDGANKGSFIQAYNAQAAVDSQAQVIVAADITQAANDSRQLLPMIDHIKVNVGRKPDAVNADAGYWSAANVTDDRAAGIDPHVATGRRKHGEREPAVSGFPRFSFRGVDNVRAEWQMVCLTSNLLKLFRSGWLPGTT